MILNLQEIFDIIMMSLIVGYIFSDYLSQFSKRSYSNYDPLKPKPRFGFAGLKFAILATAPAIILHEFGHKFVAMSFGMSATFNAAYFWLILGLMMKLMRTGFIFFVPAYISIYNPADLVISQFAYPLISFAGPAVNLILWLLSLAILKSNLVKRKYLPLIFVTAKINMFLFIFNMLPIPGFDGFKVYVDILQILF